jgi:hypothetical protein
MKRHLILTALTIAALCGTAAADRWHGGGHSGGWGHGNAGWSRGGGGWSNGGGGWHGGFSAGVTVRTPRVVYQQPRVVYQQPRVRFVRRPIYVRAPQIRVHYYDYYQQPTVLVENYPARDGYYWVAGQWTWSGYEWMWTAGHYEPVQQQYYDQGYYDQNYDNQGYYDQGYE